MSSYPSKIEATFNSKSQREEFLARLHKNELLSHTMSRPYDVAASSGSLWFDLNSKTHEVRWEKRSDRAVSFEGKTFDDHNPACDIIMGTIDRLSMSV